MSGSEAGWVSGPYRGWSRCSGWVPRLSQGRGFARSRVHSSLFALPSMHPTSGFPGWQAQATCPAVCLYSRQRAATSHKCFSFNLEQE